MTVEYLGKDGNTERYALYEKDGSVCGTIEITNGNAEFYALTRKPNRQRDFVRRTFESMTNY